MDPVVNFAARTVTLEGRTFSFKAERGLRAWMVAHCKRRAWVEKTRREREASRRYWARPENQLRLLQLLVGGDWAKQAAEVL